MQFQNWDDFFKIIHKTSIEKRKLIVQSFLKQNKTWPLIEKNRAIFLYYGKGKHLSIAGDFNGWRPLTPMRKIQGTQLWYGVQSFPIDARLEYKFVQGKSWFLDPRNPKYSIGGYGKNSDLQMSKYQVPHWVQDIPKNQGKITCYKIKSHVLRNKRTLQVYTPVNYVATQKYPLLIVHDGSDYIRLAKTTQLINLLIEKKKISPIVVAFIDPVQRFREYACSPQYLAFTQKELVPFLEKRFSITKNPQQRAFAGASMGGLISFYLAYKMHASFQNAICQSGAFIYEEMKGSRRDKIIQNFLKKIKFSLLSKSKIWIDCGNIGPLERFLLQGNRILQKKIAKEEQQTLLYRSK